LSPTKLYPIKCTVQQYIDDVDIAGHSSARARAIIKWWGGEKLFSS